MELNLSRLKSVASIPDDCPMKDSLHRRLNTCIWCGLALVGALLSGCTAVSLAGAGISVGTSVVRTTGAIGGATIDLTGSAVRTGLPDSGSSEEQETDSPDL